MGDNIVVYRGKVSMLSRFSAVYIIHVRQLDGVFVQLGFSCMLTIHTGTEVYGFL